MILLAINCYVNPLATVIFMHFFNGKTLDSTVLLKLWTKVYKTHDRLWHVLPMKHVLAMLYRKQYELSFQSSFANNNTYSRWSWRWTSLLLPWKPHTAARIKKVNLSSVESQKGRSELCSNVSHDRCIWLPVFLSNFFSQIFVDIGVFWYHPTTCKIMEIEWRLFNVNHSMFVLIFLLFFMLLVDPCKGRTRIKLR